MVNEVLQTDEEIKSLLFYLWKTRGLKEDAIEVGVYRGGSAHVLAWGLGDRSLFLYDTFDGFKDLCKEDLPGLESLFDIKGSEEQVRECFKSDGRVQIIKGFFPDSAIYSRYSFVHLDVDTYLSTKASLEYVYPRTVQGGVIILHDYLNEHLSVKKAVDEFMFLKPEKAIPLTGTSQCVIIKR